MYQSHGPNRHCGTGFLRHLTQQRSHGAFALVDRSGNYLPPALTSRVGQQQDPIIGIDDERKNRRRKARKLALPIRGDHHWLTTRRTPSHAHRLP